MDEQNVAPRTSKRVDVRHVPEGMTKDEELEYLRMENAVLKNCKS